MKSLLDRATRDELINRINSITEDSKPAWGQMNAYQMLKHCTLAEEMYLGRKRYKQTWMGSLFGRMALRYVLKSDNPFPRNAKTIPALKVSEKNGDLELQKKNWIELINEYEHYSLPFITHFFFGKMTREQVGCFAYEHADHHLRQFNR
jgi:hypothetical protein